MKTLKAIFLLSILLFASCSKDDPCNCVKYKITDEVVDDLTEILSREPVPCQDEVAFGVDDDGKNFFIRCDYE